MSDNPRLPSLRNFEDDPTPTLTPRPRTPRRSDPTSGAPAPKAHPAISTTAAPTDIPGLKPRRGRPQTRPASATATGLSRSSNVQIPADLLGPIKARRAALSLTTGELIIAAIEATADELPDLLTARPTAGGSLFKSRTAHTTRAATPLSNLNFRMLLEDFEVLDALVARFNASSRSQLVAAALTAYLSRGET